MVDPVAHAAAAAAQGPPPIALRAASGRDWRLHPLRRLHPTIQLVRDAARPSAPPLVLKTLPLPPEPLARALHDDLAAWRRAAAAEPDLLVAPLDVATTATHVHTLTPYFPAADLGSAPAHTFPRPERPALRFVFALAAADEALVAALAAPVASPSANAAAAVATQSVNGAARPAAHGAITPDHVLLDRAGAPRLAGFGLTRQKRLHAHPRATERDDVRGLARILYRLLYGAPFDPAAKRLPDRAGLSPPTRDLLADVLLRGAPKSLPEFRYDLAAARKLVPVCAPPLAPVVNRRREQLLDIDLDSSRGLADRAASHSVSSQGSLPAPPPALPPPMPPPQLLYHQQQSSQTSSSSVAPAGVAGAPQFETPHPRAGPLGLPKARPVAPAAHARAAADANGAPVADVPASFPNEPAVANAVRAIAAVELSAVPVALLDALVMATTPGDSAVGEHIFKTMFRLPISKNPVVAAKATLLLHTLVADGPAKLTSLCLANDSFLQWVEAAWTRDRLQNRPGKAHGFAYCFAAGEIGSYVAMLRRRIATHAKFLDVVTTHWLVRFGPDGATPVLDDAKRRELARMVLDVVEQAAAILRKFAGARDAAAPVKAAAVPALAMEIAKSYQVLCWIVATAPEPLARDLYPELQVSHAAARGAMDALRADAELVEQCSPLAVLDLDEAAPTPASMDAMQIVAMLKKMKKRKKKRRDVAAREPVAVADANTNGKHEVSPPTTQPVSAPPDDEPEESVQYEPEEKPVRVNGDVESRHARRRTSRTEDVLQEDDSGEVVSDRRPPLAENGVRDDVGFHKRLPPLSRTSVTDTDVSTNGLRKLSLSVRRDGAKPLPTARESRFAPPPPLADDARPNGRRTSVDSARRVPNGSGSPENGRRLGAREPSDERRLSAPNGSRQSSRISSNASDSSDDESQTRRNRAATGSVREENGSRGSRRKSPRRKSPSTESSSESEEDEASERSYVPRRRNGAKKGGTRKSRRDDDEVELKSEESDRAETKKKSGRKQHPDERKIPFDKSAKREDGRRRRSSSREASAASDEHSGGSKEALAAAAQGRKTPKMNSAFEVAPYEVHFGPQIGSGGFGVVYKAKFRNDTVAVKKIHGHALSNAASVGEFQSEVAVLCTLNHPNILRFVGACTRPPNLMIITEFMARGTLFDLLHQSQTRVTWPMRKKFALDTCKGMKYLHDSKLLHRDLKSSNLMLDKELNCKVGDFGLTRISKGAAAVQMTGQCGTFQYMAVEVLANKPYSEKADVFSFGILLWEMVARKLPYFGMQPMQVGIAVVQQNLRPTIPPKCPAPLSKLMQACWDNDPTRRPSFAQLVDALDAMPE